MARGLRRSPRAARRRHAAPPRTSSGGGGRRGIPRRPPSWMRPSPPAPAAAAAATAPAAAAAASAFAFAVAEAEPPYTRPKRETCRPYAQMSASEIIEGLAAELDHAIPGLGEVATKAKVLHLPASPLYVQKVLAWIAEHEAAEFGELVAYGEQVTGFAGMKELPSARFVRELRAAAADAGAGGR
mmetsp:Transcript_133262/g.426361  ORF Transcript_133262/g.426361 Transcript_133262/m.426361 type:complete len:185 (+) Transcript_133262:1275-1829(+)